MKVDRIVGQATKSLTDILAWRHRIYENSYEVRVIVCAGETPEEIAIKVKAAVERYKTGSYASTRGESKNLQNEPLDFLDVVGAGLASDRGLYVPSNLDGLKFSLKEYSRLQSL